MHTKLTQLWTKLSQSLLLILIISSLTEASDKNISCQNHLERSIATQIHNQLNQSEPSTEEFNQELFYETHRQLNQLWLEIFSKENKSTIQSFLIEQLTDLARIEATERNWRQSSLFENKLEFYSFHIFGLNHLQNLESRKKLIYSELTKNVIEKNVLNFSELPLVLKYRIFEFAVFIFENNQNFANEISNEISLFSNGVKLYTKYSQTLALNNLRILFKYSRNMSRRGRANSGDSLEVYDLFQEVFLGGMLRAVELYDPQKGSLLTVLVPHIQMSLQSNGINFSRLIPLPAAILSQLFRITHLIEQKAIAKSERQPSIETLAEIAQEMNLTAEGVNTIVALQQLKPDRSFDLNESNSRANIDGHLEIDAMVSSLEFQQRILGVVRRISSKTPQFTRNWKIFLRYHNLEEKDDTIIERISSEEKEPSLADVAREFGISTGRVGQINEYVKQRVFATYIKTYGAKPE